MTPSELEKHIRAEYAEAYRDISLETKRYFDKFSKRDIEQLQRLNNGEITQDYYNSWRINQIGRGERWEELKKRIDERLQNAGKVSTSYINDTTPSVYTLNRNYTAYQIDTSTEKGVSWTAWDEGTLKRLQTDERQLVPLARTNLNINKLSKWNREHLQSALVSGILQGKSVSKIADSFEALALMDRNTSLRNARTALTGAQNAGRQQAYAEAEEMGIDIKKEWICTQDNRTRDSHAELDGQIVPHAQPFVTKDGREIMYPGDPTAEPCEVWNCRCTMRAVLPKYTKNRPTYQDWLDGNSPDTYNKKLSEINDKDELVEYFNRMYNIYIKDINKADFEVIKSALTGIDNMIKEYPIISDYVDEISAKKTGLMASYINKIYFNPDYFKSKNDIEEAINNGINKGNAIQGCTAKDIGAHECGHILEGILIQLNPSYSNPYEEKRAWDAMTESKSIVKEAIKNLKQEGEFEHMKTKDIQGTISGYAKFMYAETMAEAFCDKSINGDRMSSLSKEIIRVTNKRLKEYGGIKNDG